MMLGGGMIDAPPGGLESLPGFNWNCKKSQTRRAAPPSVPVPRGLPAIKDGADSERPATTEEAATVEASAAGAAAKPAVSAEAASAGEAATKTPALGTAAEAKAAVIDMEQEHLKMLAQAKAGADGAKKGCPTNGTKLLKRPSSAQVSATEKRKAKGAAYEAAYTKAYDRAITDGKPHAKALALAQKAGQISRQLDM